MSIGTFFKRRIIRLHPMVLSLIHIYGFLRFPVGGDEADLRRVFKKYPIEAQFMGPDPAVLHRLADSCLLYTS